MEHFSSILFKITLLACEIAGQAHPNIKNENEFLTLIVK
jgi:hypothetical protein